MWHVYKSDDYGAFRKFPHVHVTNNGDCYFVKSTSPLQKNKHEKVCKWVCDRKIPNFRYSRFICRQSGICAVMGDPFRESDERLTTYFAISLECSYPVVHSLMFALNRFFM